VSALGLTLYRTGTGLLRPLARHVLKERARNGKEDPARLSERYGQASQVRPEGELIWIHAASVGESLVALTLAERLLETRPQSHLLITSGTQTSASLIARRKLDRVIHQFPPVDAPQWVNAFIDHWQPDLAVFTESELWPNLIDQTQARSIPLALINARMNDKSLQGWARWPHTARTVLGAFDWIGAADQRTADGICGLLDTPVPLVGNLKLECGLPDPDPEALDQLKASLGDRPVFVAASTHAGEEDLIAQTQVQLLKTHPDALMILAPRHPERAQHVGDCLDAAGLTYAQRSRGETPTRHPVWLADTLGEMALWYAVCPVTIIAGSLIEGIGGHNPVEATRAGCAVITGPYVDSFADVFAAYDARQARLIGTTAQELADHVRRVWSGEGPELSAAHSALTTLSGGALARTLAALNALLDQDPVR